MFKTIINAFLKETKSREIKSLPQPLPSPDSKMIDKGEAFIVDFLFIKEDEVNLQNPNILFPVNNQSIIINGVKSFFDVSYICEEGFSKDKRYCKVSTPQYRFWIKPIDYIRFKSVLEHRRGINRENQKARDERIKLNNVATFEYDPIDNDIYSCFITHKSGMTERIGTWESFNFVEEKLGELCNTHGGLYYKNPTKTAKFAIIFSPNNRVYTSVNELREKGYKVTTFEKTLEYFGISQMWDIEALIKAEKEHKQFMRKLYK